MTTFSTTSRAARFARRRGRCAGSGRSQARASARPGGPRDQQSSSPPVARPPERSSTLRLTLRPSPVEHELLAVGRHPGQRICRSTPMLTPTSAPAADRRFDRNDRELDRTMRPSALRTMGTWEGERSGTILARAWSGHGSGQPSGDAGALRANPRAVLRDCTARHPWRLILERR